jgi:uncharacterized protein YjbI with pentapeptide repeats
MAILKPDDPVPEQPSFSATEKSAGLLNSESAAKKLDIWLAIERICTILNAIGVVAIPFAILFFTLADSQQKEAREKQKRAQEAIKTYLNQLTTVYLGGDLEGNKPESERLRRITRASILALLNDPDLDGDHKRQIVEYLTELDLVQAKGPTEKEQPPLIYLSAADFSHANLSRVALRGVYFNAANFSHADLSDADFSFARFLDAKFHKADLKSTNLRGANLSGADLSHTDFSNANLSFAKLSDTVLIDPYLRALNTRDDEYNYSADDNLKDPNLSHAIFTGADFKDADLGKANLRGANFKDADLTNANLSSTKNLTDTQLEAAKLCRTKLPEGSKLNPNRDCEGGSGLYIPRGRSNISPGGSPSPGSSPSSGLYIPRRRSNTP